MNLGTRRGYSALEMIDAFESVFGFKVLYRFATRRAGDVSESCANLTKAQKLLKCMLVYN